ncbi:MAG: hypothetical protein FKY71_18610 [Spiribacter salinus]|uniref:Uncharacterized protein n=1 Tax=Spiribacter salinus TaxID=1335746 RepID=A0A540V869_9GAMM|nr:MAG: hypothetical protein FKY71_18610 [Spiribacter salinus]
MLEKRKITTDEVETAPILEVMIPDYDGASHPFSFGKNPEIYTEIGLKKVAKSDTNRTDWFLKRLCTVWDIIEAPVPFYFFAANGELRSLDAGCVGYLVHKPEPLLELKLGNKGFISSVSPTSKALELSEPMMMSLRQKMTPDE